MLPHFDWSILIGFLFLSFMLLFYCSAVLLFLLSLIVSILLICVPEHKFSSIIFMFLNTIRLRSFCCRCPPNYSFPHKKIPHLGVGGICCGNDDLTPETQVEIIDGLGIKSHLVRVVKTSFLGSLTLFFIYFFFSLLVDMVTLWTHIVCTICSLHYF